jgi:hypothetical protein
MKFLTLTIIIIKKKKKKEEEEGISLQILLNLGYLGNKNPLELNFILVAHNRYI